MNIIERFSEFKIPRSKGCAGSSPALGTKNGNEIGEFFKKEDSPI
jgi:hypothetical protein